jgi:hypothetical protein
LLFRQLRAPPVPEHGRFYSGAGQRARLYPRMAIAAFSAMEGRNLGVGRVTLERIRNSWLGGPLGGAGGRPRRAPACHEHEDPNGDPQAAPNRAGRARS